MRKPDSDYHNHCPKCENRTVIIIITVRNASPWTVIMTSLEFCAKNFLTTQITVYPQAEPSKRTNLGSYG